MGFKWKKPAGSGLQSIIWRSQWEASGEQALKRSLLIYNANDCEALEVVANKLLQLQRLAQNPEQPPDIVFTASLKWKHPFGFKRNKFALTDFDTINKAAYWDYQRERVYVKSHGNVKRALRFASHQKKSVRPNKIIEWGANSRYRKLIHFGWHQFTTSTAENPTLTIVALAIRQADFIADQMAKYP